jgi:hypothetical protein
VNPETEVSRLLAEAGAVLVRQNKHLVYRLPNGNMFTRNKTPSDHRTPLNELSDLRRALGIVRTPKEKEPIMNHHPQNEQPSAVPPTKLQPHQEASGLAQDNLQTRIEVMMAREEATQERLMAEAQQVERRIHMLKALLPFAEDPASEVALQALIPPRLPAAPPPFEPPEPPQHITERVQVTRQLVLAATQTFENTFTINDVMALMTGGRQIDPSERARIRSSIAQCVIGLYDRGELVKEAEHFGRKQTIWRKAVLSGSRSDGVGTRA